jgi:hypothetical protein
MAGLVVVGAFRAALCALSRTRLNPFCFRYRYVLLPGQRRADVLVSIAFLVFVPVGALIASRHPGNAIGWILCTIGLLVGVQFFAG